MIDRIKYYGEATLYALLIIIACFASVMGSMEIKFFPILLIVGVICAHMYDRKLFTSIYAALISFFMMIFLINGSNVTSALKIAFYAFVMTMCGEFIAVCIKSIKKDKKREKDSKKLVITDYVCIIFLIMIGCAVTSNVNGNVIDYVKAKTELKHYLNSVTTYNDYIIHSKEYISQQCSEYNFYIDFKEKEDVYNFSVMFKDGKILVLDEEIEKEKEEKEKKLTKEANEYLSFLEIECKIKIVDEKRRIYIIQNADNIDEIDEFLNMCYEAVKMLNEKEMSIKEADITFENKSGIITNVEDKESYILALRGESVE